MIRKRCNQKEIPIPKTKVGKLETCTKKTYSKPSEQLFSNRRPLSYLKLKYEKAHKVQTAQKSTKTIRTTTKVSLWNDQ